MKGHVFKVLLVNYIVLNTKQISIGLLKLLLLLPNYVFLYKNSCCLRLVSFGSEEGTTCLGNWGKIKLNKSSFFFGVVFDICFWDLVTKFNSNICFKIWLIWICVKKFVFKFIWILIDLYICIEISYETHMCSM